MHKSPEKKGEGWGGGSWQTSAQVPAEDMPCAGSRGLQPTALGLEREQPSGGPTWRVEGWALTSGQPQTPVSLQESWLWTPVRCWDNYPDQVSGGRGSKARGRVGVVRALQPQAGEPNLDIARDS